LLIDGLSVEPIGQNPFDLGQRVEPADDLFAFAAVLEAVVELRAHRPGQAGNFSDACHEFDLLFEFVPVPCIPW
jgi:hypothetical protein